MNFQLGRIDAPEQHRHFRRRSVSDLRNYSDSSQAIVLVFTSFSSNQETLVRGCRTYAVLMTGTLSGPFDIELVHTYASRVNSIVP